MAIRDSRAAVNALKRFLWLPACCILCLGMSCAESAKDRLLGHVSYLASRRLAGRVPATEGDSLARAYIGEQFARCGLEPIGVEGYLQPFPFLTDIQVSQSALALVADGRTKPLLHGSEFVVDIRSGSGTITAEAVFIGCGISSEEEGYDDFRKVDLRERIAVCYLYPPKHIDPKIRSLAFKLPFVHKIDLARSSGAVGLAFVLPDGDGGLTPVEDEIGDKTHPPQFIEQSGIPVVRITHGVLNRVLRESGTSLEGLDSVLATASESVAVLMPDVSLALNVVVKYKFDPAYNVMGFMRGEDPEKTLVIGAHYDHIGTLSDGVLRVGADDNASGVSVMLELARRCSNKNDYDCNLLFVAFGAEEWGFRGSRWFLDHLPESVGDIKAMINYDTVGRIESDTLWIHHAQSAVEWEQLISAVSNEELEICYGPNRSATDSSLFNEAGIPVLWFYCGHQGPEVPGREVENINISGMNRLVNYSYELIRRTATRGTILTYQTGRAQMEGEQPRQIDHFTEENLRGTR